MQDSSRTGVKSFCNLKFSWEQWAVQARDGAGKLSGSLEYTGQSRLDRGDSHTDIKRKGKQQKETAPGRAVAGRQSSRASRVPAP